MQASGRMARETAVRFAPGARIGDYLVEREVAIEETAVVYLATHVVLPRQAHVKVTHPGSKTAAVQLLREACILEALSHAGIPRVHECGVLSDRRPWSAIERMPGALLKQLAGDGPLALADLAVALRDLADILQHAHERGVVHRRLTAAAIVRTQRRRGGHAICDWTDARTLDSETDAGVDPRDDVHALGTIAFRLLTGRPHEPAASAAPYCPAAPAELVALVDQMVAEPVARPAASEVFERALWLCDTLEVSPLFERPRWTPPQSIGSEGISVNHPTGDHSEFAVRISQKS
jgi:serine/threonine protein kinase